MAVQLLHQLPVHRPSRRQGVGQLTAVGFEAADLRPLSVFFGLQLAGAVLQFLQRRGQRQPAGDVGLGAQLSGQALARRPPR